MIIYTTCATCRGLMQVTREDGTDVFHPTCDPPPPSRMDKLLEDFLAAAQMGDQPALEAQLEREIEELQSRPPRLKDAALAYVSWGWPVFPLRPREKRPATPNGFHDATLDATRVAEYWTRYPDANIGLPTGVMFDVVDIDVPQGTETLCRLIKEGKVDALVPKGDGKHPVHGKVVTASGGQHWYVPPTGNGNKADVYGKVGLHGIDFRGNGGYVVAPPSWLGERGRSWSWLVKPSPTIRRA